MHRVASRQNPVKSSLRAISALFHPIFRHNIFFKIQPESFHMPYSMFSFSLQNLSLFHGCIFIIKNDIFARISSFRSSEVEKQVLEGQMSDCLIKDAIWDFSKISVKKCPNEILAGFPFSMLF